jgi:hypothetical protein
VGPHASEVYAVAGGPLESPSPERVFTSLATALYRQLFPAVHSVAFDVVGDDPLAIELRVILDPSAEEPAVEVLQDALTVVYRDFPRGSFHMVQRFERVSRDAQVPPRGRVLYVRRPQDVLPEPARPVIAPLPRVPRPVVPEGPPLRVALDAAGCPIGVVAVLESEGAAPVRRPLLAARVTFGRGADNDVRITGDSKVSRYHFAIAFTPDGVFVEDTTSAGGTLVDGELITRRRLAEGAVIVAGETSIRVAP